MEKYDVGEAGEQEWQIAEYVSIGIIVMHIVLGFRMNKVLLRP